MDDGMGSERQTQELEGDGAGLGQGLMTLYRVYFGLWWLADSEVLQTHHSDFADKVLSTEPRWDNTRAMTSARPHCSHTDTW